MNNKIPETCSTEQKNKLNELLNLNKDYYGIHDIFNILPQKIIYNGDTGYLKISCIDIVYSSLETEMQGKIVAMCQFMIGDKNIYDAFIDMINWLKNQNLM